MSVRTAEQTERLQRRAAPASDAPWGGLLSARAAALRLGVHERTVRRAIARGELPAIKRGGAFRIALSDLTTYQARMSGAILETLPSVERPVTLLPLPGLYLPAPPVPLTRLLGRERELAAAAALLRDERVRLLTLTGPGGVGKTRLAIALMEAVADLFADGVGFIGLAAIREPEQVAAGIARALGLRETDLQAPVERIAGHLGDRRCLILLDNFEQVVEAAPLVPAMLVACPELKILVTSRAPLRVSGERELAVPPLSLWPGGRVVGSGDTTGPTVPLLSTSDAVALFVERAQAVRPDFALTAENAGAVAEICARLDGLPLAIELAAARTRALPPPALLGWLGRRLPLLTGGARDQPARLRTMRAAIAWSYDLLTPEEQRLFRRLAVFAGGFTLEAAEYVGGIAPAGVTCPSSPAPVRGDAPAVLDGVEALVRQSLLTPVATARGAARYQMLETIREFAAEALEERGEATGARRAHAEYVVALAEHADEVFWGVRPGDWRALLADEYDNARAAWEWLIGAGEIEQALRLATALKPLWAIVGHVREGALWLETALAAPVATSPRVRALALAMAAQMAVALGDYSAGIARAEDGLALARAHDERFAVAIAEGTLGLAWQFAGDEAAARAYLLSAAAGYREIGQRGRLGRILFQLATLGDLGSFDRPGDPVALAQATAYCEEALAIYRELGMQVGLGWALDGLGNLAYKRGDYATADRLLREVLVIRWELHDVWGLPPSFEDLGDVAGMTGQPERAARLYGAAEVLRERLGLPIPGSYRDEYAREIEVSRRALGAEAFAAALAAGRALSLEEAVAEALAAPVADAGAVGAARGRPPATEAALTQRERQILDLMAAGLSNRAIAAALFISLPTTKRHVSNILGKLDLPSRAAAIAYALRPGGEEPAAG